MNLITADQIKKFSHEFGLTWKKALLLAALGGVLGLLCALALPIPVS